MFLTHADRGRCFVAVGELNGRYWMKRIRSCEIFKRLYCFAEGTVCAPTQTAEEKESHIQLREMKQVRMNRLCFSDMRTVWAHVIVAWMCFFLPSQHYECFCLGIYENSSTWKLSASLLTSTPYGIALSFKNKLNHWKWMFTFSVEIFDDFKTFLSSKLRSCDS